MTYRVFNHNDTLLGEFTTAADAYAEAEFYMDQTGNYAYVMGVAK
jgi:hypothetical protein